MLTAPGRLLHGQTASPPPPDPLAMVERGLKTFQRNEELAQQYTFLEEAVEREHKDGAVARSKSETWEVLILYGEPYRRLIRKDGKPLSEKDEEKEQRKLDKLSASRSGETPEQREKRVARFREDRRKGREFLNEIPKAFSFRIAGERKIDGLDAWAIEATPRPEFKPSVPRAGMLSKFKGTFYVAKESGALLLLESEAIDTVSFGLFLARLNKGARFSLKNIRVNNEIWMPSRIKVDFDVRLALVKKLKVDVEINYSEFRKFQTDSKILAVDPVQ